MERKLLDMITDRSAKPPTARTEWANLPPLPSAKRQGPEWYVVRTVPFREAKVRDALEERGFGTFVPLISEERVKRRFRWGRFYEERRRKIVLCFPGYLFVTFDVQRPDWRTIYAVDDVLGILHPPGAPERPYPVCAAAIDALIGLGYDRPIVKEAVQALIQKGALVTVDDGPFTGFPAIVSESTKDRLKVLVGVFGRDTSVELKPNQVTVAR